MSIFGIIELLFVIAFVVILMICLKKKFIIVMAVMAFIGVVIVGVMNLDYFYYNSDKVTISSEVDMNNEVQIVLKNHYMCYRGYVEFACKYDEEHMKDIICNQFDNVIYDEENHMLYIIDNNMICSLYYVNKSENLLSDRYIYRLRDERKNINDARDSMEDIIIPFPDSKIDRSAGIENNSYGLYCDFEELKKYYENIDNAEIFENEIVISLDTEKISIKSAGEKRIVFIIIDVMHS